MPGYGDLELGFVGMFVEGAERGVANTHPQKGPSRGTGGPRPWPLDTRGWGWMLGDGRAAGQVCGQGRGGRSASASPQSSGGEQGVAGGKRAQERVCGVYTCVVCSVRSVYMHVCGVHTRVWCVHVCVVCMVCMVYAHRCGVCVVSVCGVCICVWYVCM